MRFGDLRETLDISCVSSSAVSVYRAIKCFLRFFPNLLNLLNQFFNFFLYRSKMCIDIIEIFTKYTRCVLKCFRSRYINRLRFCYD